MDRSLKARLIGATVLVVLAVILIPELLSGRRTAGEAQAPGESPGARTLTIELDGAGGRPGAQLPSPPPPAATAGSVPAARAAPAAPVAAAPAALPASRQDPPRGTGAAPAATAPVPEARTALESTPPKAAPAASEPHGAARVEASAPAGRTADASRWLVQVGAFGSADKARSLVGDLEAAGLPAHVSPVTRDGRTLHRVRVGPVAGRAEAGQLARRLEARGLPATLVAVE